MKPLDISTINPGVRELVRLLRSWGYDTTDSGDGCTNVAAGMEGARIYPHVSMVVKPRRLVDDADRLVHLLGMRGVVVRQLGPEVGSPAIQASYDPATRVAIIELIGVDDPLLAGAVPAPP